MLMLFVVLLRKLGLMFGKLDVFLLGCEVLIGCLLVMFDECVKCYFFLVGSFFGLWF